MSAPKPETLKEAMDRLYATKWHHHRDGGKVTLSQATWALNDVCREIGIPMESPLWQKPLTERFTANEVTHAHIRKATQQWYKLGLSPATITKRLNLLGAMGVNVAGLRPPKDRRLKWWLTPEEKAKAMSALNPFPIIGRKREALLSREDADGLWSHIDWTVVTGLRVEETMALTHESFSQDLMTVNVPGTKTSTSQATLPLTEDAYLKGMALLEYRLKDYGALEAAWRKLREAMGWPQGATLKALRRNAARYLHVDRGMPLDMVRQYLRHEDINTTMEYLRLTGGYRLDEMRRYLR